ncbi:hypothetical protein N7481_005423 [Penicillium waksmanii]|uniref:uncharacterized protein n=1 Tax=Penicillium waksmanii TaxID=69791 RepID=UPI0025469B22|nr:uncharacterized protein N7481_005423 [Penicillium waksmanii]KAJ5983324.1 hypothetical protein N7481_005423 [Penicillium waksmanii]
MEPLKIRVNGESSITRLAEQGLLRLSVESQGPKLETVSKEVVSRSNELTGLFKTLSPKTQAGTATADAAVTNVASTFLSTRNFTPRDRDGQPLEKVYQASMSLSIVFRDITKLSEVVGQLLTYSNVEISSIDWSLSEATQKTLGSQVRREAIRDAVTKANDYAAEVGREVYAVDIMDGGQNATMQHAPVGRSLFGSAPAPSGGGLFGGSATAGFGCATPQASQPSEMLSLSPQNIKFTSSVHIEFQSYPESNG